MSILYLLPESGRDLAAEVMKDSPLPGRHVTPDAFQHEPLADVTGIILSTSHYTAALRDRLQAEAKNLRWIQSLSTGVDVILACGMPPGVTLTSASGAHAPSVADHALSLVLSLTRASPTFALAQDSRHWVPWAELPEQRSLFGLRAAVVGNGPSGVATAKRLAAFEARVTLVGRRRKDQPADVAFAPISDLDALLPQTELLVMVLPSTPETVGILSAGRLAALPKGALLVNVGRGDALDEAALADLLNSGHLAGAGLDVMASEPLPETSPLWTAKGAVLTPHVAGRSAMSHRLVVDLVGENLRRFVSGTPLLNIMAN